MPQSETPVTRRDPVGETPSFLEPFDGHIASPRAFRAVGLESGVKQNRPDLAVILSERAATAAGVFTRNRVQAAPVHYSRRALEDGRARAVVVNAGSANACTGERGERDAEAMAEQTAAALGLASSEVLVASTGVIGQPLAMDKISPAIAEAGRRLEAPLDTESRDAGGRAAAAAILTTDTVAKCSAVRVDCGGGNRVTLGGIAKGSGMIEPDMATTLAFVTTDAAVASPQLAHALRAATEKTFNCITVDGDTSTNDCIFLLANGAAEVDVEGAEAAERFALGLEWLLRQLAVAVVRDGEGATRLVRIDVEGAASDQEARRAAKTVANSPLVKTAIHGGEPNWGRILPAVGRSGVEMDVDRIRIWAGDLQIVEAGLGLHEDLSPIALQFQRPEVSLRIDLGLGAGRATVWGCDLSAEYVRINGSYMS